MLRLAEHLIGSYPPTTPAPMSSLDPLDVVGNSCHQNGTGLGPRCYGDATQFW
jgi:hypothetical protein